MRRNPVTWNNSATPVTPLYGLHPWTFSTAVVIVCEFVECFASVIMLSIWICERKEESDVPGGAHAVCLHWLKFLPTPSSHFSPPYTHISPGELAAYLHMYVALRTDYHLSVHQNPGALKQIATQRRIKKRTPRLLSQLFYPWSIHTRQSCAVLIVSFLKTCMMPCAR